MRNKNTEDNKKKVAVVAGVGSGLGMALCQRLLAEGYLVAGLSRSNKTQDDFGDNYLAIKCELTDPLSVNDAITQVEKKHGKVSIYIHNAASLIKKDFLQTTIENFRDQWSVTCMAAVHGIQRVLPAMLNERTGTILVTGATASIKAGAGFSAFSSAKFALRGLTQSLTREYVSQGVHIAHIVVDGAIWGWQAEKKFAREKQDCLLPEAIADTYLHLIQQHRSAWTHELDLRTDVESF